LGMAVDCGFSVLITGANRGIGLGLVHRFLERPDVKLLFATCRKPENADGLTSIDDPRLHTVVLDARCDKSIEAACNQVSTVVGDKGLNLLINNAGILYDTPPDLPMRFETNETIDVNTVGPLIVSQVFLPLLMRAAEQSSCTEMGIKRAAVINITSDLGSIADNFGSPINAGRSSLAYRISKAGLNQVTKTLAIDWKKYNILVAGIHPGWVRTDMGTNEGKLSKEESAKGIEQTASGFTAKDSGGYFEWTGKPMNY